MSRSQLLQQEECDTSSRWEYSPNTAKHEWNRLRNFSDAPDSPCDGRLSGVRMFGVTPNAKAGAVHVEDQSQEAQASTSAGTLVSLTPYEDDFRQFSEMVRHASKYAEAVFGRPPETESSEDDIDMLSAPVPRRRIVKVETHEFDPQRTRKRKPFLSEALIREVLE